MNKTDKHIYIKTYIVYILFLIAMITVIYKVFSIQFQYKNEIAFVNNLGKKNGLNKDSIVFIEPIRGEIKDEKGNALVTSVPYYEIRFDPSVVKEKLFKDSLEFLCEKLSDIFFEKTSRQWISLIKTAKNRGNRYLKIKKNITHDALTKVKKFPIFNQDKNAGGFIVIRTVKRKQSKGIMAARTLGYVRDKIRVGIEDAFNNQLSGIKGEIVLTKLGGVWRPISSNLNKEPVDGADVWTTINSDIQEVAENELMKQLKLQGAKHGSVVVMEVKTGFVKAIANLSKINDSNYYETYNHAIGRATEPGSTFKLASLMALLEDGKISLNDSVYADGVYEFYDAKLHDSKLGGYGKISIKRAFELSSNVLAKVVHYKYKNNPQEFINRLNSFGLSKPLGVSIRGEGMPLIKNQGENNWSGISLPWMSIGYETKLTPLQTLAFYNAVANNGRLVKPQFVSKINSNGKLLKEKKTEVLIDKICSQSTIDKLKKCLEGVVNQGTGRALKTANLKIAGKTGTARIARGNSGYGKDSEIKHQASFVGYFPAENPKYSCIVVIAAPNKSIYGSKVSGTVFSAIANKVYSSDLEFHPAISNKKNIASMPIVKSGNAYKTKLVLDSLNIKRNNTISQYVYIKKNPNKIKLESRFIGKNTVPNTIGMGLQDAMCVLNQAGLEVDVYGYGKVVKQSISPGVKIVNKRNITIKLQ